MFNAALNRPLPLPALGLFVTGFFFSYPLHGDDKYSIEPYASLAAESFYLADGGNSSGWHSAALLDFGFDASLAPDLQGHVTFLGYGGDREVDAFTGDFGVFSNLITDSEIILFTAWLQQSLDKGYVKFGQLAADESFMVSENALLYLNSNFGPLPILSGNTAAPIYSVGGAGIELYQEIGSGYWQAGIYAGDSGPGDADDHGLNWRTGGEAGYIIINEFAWSYTMTERFPGILKLGAFYASGDFDHYTDNTIASGNYGIYVVWDQEVASFDNGATANLFSRIGISPQEDRNTVSKYGEIGINFNGLLPGRPQDVLGFAYSYTSFSNDYRNSLALEGANVTSNEQVFEATFLTNMAENWSFQPNLQYILNPHSGAENVLLGGVRVVADF